MVARVLDFWCLPISFKNRHIQNFLKLHNFQMWHQLFLN